MAIAEPFAAAGPTSWSRDAGDGEVHEIRLDLGGLHPGDATRLLEETRLSAFTFGEHGVRWDGYQLSLADLAESRRYALGVGSCSFDEPLADLAVAGLR